MTKRILSLMVSLALIMSIAAVPFTVGAAVIEGTTQVTLIDEGFEGYEAGTDVVDEIASWGEARDEQFIDKKVTTATRDGSNTNTMELKVTQSVSSGYSNSIFYRNVDSQQGTGLYVLSFDAYINSLKKGKGFWIHLNKDANGSTSNGTVILRNYYNTSKGMSFKGSANEHKYLTLAKVGDWQNYKIVYDSLNKKAALYLDGVNVLPLAVQSDDDSSMKVDTVGSVTFCLIRDNAKNDSVLFDNITLTYQSIAEYDAINTLPDNLVYEDKPFALPKVGEMGSSITWSSSDPTVITNEGVVIPSTEEDKTVTLTATVNDTVSEPVPVYYEITIPKAESLGALDAANAAADAEAIVLPEYTGQKKFDLPTVGSLYESEIKWASNSAVINAENGTITLPKEDTVVTLTATVRKGEAEVTREFTYKFYEKGTIFSEDFSYPSVADGYEFINGFNGWTAEIDDYDGDYDKESVKAFVNGGELVFTQSSNTENPATYVISKNFPLVTNGVATFTMDTIVPENGNFSMSASGVYAFIGGLQINMRFSRFRVKGVDDSSWSSYCEAGAVTEGTDKKLTLTIVMNIDTSKATVSVNGVTHPSEFNLGAVNGVEIYPQRVQTLSDKTTGAEFSIDNIKVTHATSKLQIADLSFVDANGDAVIGRTDGGKLAGVTVAAIDEDIPSVKIFAVVYESDGKTIKSIAIGEKTNLVTDVANVITFDNPAALPDEDAENSLIKLFAWTSDALVPLNLSPYVYSKTGQQIKFVMCGDSISCKYNPEKTLIVGVGMEIGDYFDSDKVSVLNIAKSGASTKSFWEERQELQNNLGSINNGDYVFLMFGHNDSHDEDPAKYTEPNTTYKAYLTKMINLVRTKGAIPVLLSPVVRCKWNDDGVTINNNSLKPYADAMYALSQELNIRYIDVNAATKTLIENYGKDSDEVNAFYLFNKNYEAGFVTTPENDGTHLTETGASIVAGIVADAINENGWLPAGYYIGK